MSTKYTLSHTLNYAYHTYLSEIRNGMLNVPVADHLLSLSLVSIWEEGMECPSSVADHLVSLSQVSIWDEGMECPSSVADHLLSLSLSLVSIWDEGSWGTEAWLWSFIIYNKKNDTFFKGIFSFPPKIKSYLFKETIKRLIYQNKILILSTIILIFNKVVLFSSE